MRRAVLVAVLAASCGPKAVRTPSPPEAPAEEPADRCPEGGWPTAAVVDGAHDSGFEPTIAWNPVTGAPVLFDVAQELDAPPTHWLRLVEGRPGGWSEPRTLEGMVSGVMAAAVDGAGLVHVAFTRFDATGQPYLGTVGAGAAWRVEGPIEPGLGFIGDRMSMILGPDGEVAIAYSDHATRTVKIASRRGGAWQLETVVTDASLMRDHTLVRDRGGGLHVVAQDWRSGEVRLFSRAADGSWPFALVGEHGEGASLAVDGDDRLHVSWIDWKQKELRHAVGPAAGPFATTTLFAGDVGNDSSIAVAADGTVRVAFDRRDCGDLYLASRSPGATEWTTELVDAAGEVGADSSIVLDDRGCVHLVYDDSAAWDLKYATRCP